MCKNICNQNSWSFVVFTELFLNSKLLSCSELLWSGRRCVMIFLSKMVEKEVLQKKNEEVNHQNWMISFR